MLSLSEWHYSQANLMRLKSGFITALWHHRKTSNMRCCYSFHACKMTCFHGPQEHDYLQQHTAGRQRGTARGAADLPSMLS